MANIGGNLGAMMGSRREAKGYSKAKQKMEELKKVAGETRDYMDPWGQYRKDYSAQLNRILQGEEDWKTDPGYQFRQDESARAIERSAAAKGHMGSPNVMMALQQRSQDIASAEYGNIINRLIGLGNATPEAGLAAGQTYGNMMQTAILGQAEAEIGGAFAKGRYHAYGGEAVHGIGSMIGSFFGMNFDQGQASPTQSYTQGQGAGASGFSTSNRGSTGGFNLGQSGMNNLMGSTGSADISSFF